MFWKVLGIILLVLLVIVLLFIAACVGAVGILFIIAKAADEMTPEEFAEKVFANTKPDQLDTITPYIVALGKRFTPEEPVKKTTKKKVTLNESKKKK